MKSPHNVENLSQEQQEKKLNLNPLQKVYCIYGLIYFYTLITPNAGHYRIELIENFRFFIITSVIAVVSAPLILIYNHKNETHKANKRFCSMIALVNIGLFVNQVVQYLLGNEQI